MYMYCKTFVLSFFTSHLCYGHWDKSYKLVHKNWKKDGQSVSTLEFTLTIKKVKFILETDACTIDSSKHSTHKVDIISWKGDHNFVWLKIIIYVSSFHHTWKRFPMFNNDV